ncbi:MAG: hypothetical protein ACYC2R_15915, partial [Burkholderiales bacterium]
GGNDYLEGGQGQDTLKGGLGYDVYKTDRHRLPTPPAPASATTW